jgi:lysozyme family protein
MKFTRDTLRTILALLLVIIIVVATFAYGNAQRNKQQAKNDTKVTETQDSSPTNEKSATVATPNPPDPNIPDQSTVPSTTPATGGTAQQVPTSIPAAGGELSYGLPLAFVAIAVYAYVRSRQRLGLALTR